MKGRVALSAQVQHINLQLPEQGEVKGNLFSDLGIPLTS